MVCNVLLLLLLARQTPDYGAQSWSPYLARDIHIQALERVQRRATKLIPDLAHLPYEACCRSLGLQSLEERGVRGIFSWYFDQPHKQAHE